MPRVTTRTKSNRGAERSCRRCGRRIEPGERVYSYSFRYGGAYFHCQEHYPRASELTQSKMAEVYAAQEAEDLSDCATIDDVRAAVERVGEVAQQVAEEYREAAEPFGGEGENAERADELAGWADELANFQPEDDGGGEDDLIERVVAEMERDGFSRDDEAEWSSVLDARMQDAEPERERAEALEAARQEADELIGGCPL